MTKMLRNTAESLYGGHHRDLKTHFHSREGYAT